MGKYENMSMEELQKELKLTEKFLKKAKDPMAKKGTKLVDSLQRKYDKINEMIHNLDETTTAAASSGAYTSKFPGISFRDKDDRYKPIKVGKMVESVMDKIMEDFVAEEEIAETTDSSSSGQYSQPSIWAKSTSKKDWRGASKPMWKGGKIIKFNKKCTGYDNQPYCSQGAVDNPFELITDKKGAKEVVNLYESLSKKTGKSVDEIKNIIKEYIKTK